MKERVKRHKRKLVRTDLPTNLHDDLTGAITSSLLNLSSFSSSPASAWDDVVRFKASYQFREMFSKFSDASTVPAEERKSKAIAKWLSMESRNAKTNTRLLIDETDFGPFSSEKVKRVARRVVSQIIGQSPNLCILDGMFSNGASTRVKRGPVTIAQKFVGEAHVSTSAWPLFKTHVLDNAPRWALSVTEGLTSFLHVESSVMFTVPKNSEIDRVACKEPEINMYMQRGVGNYIADALRVKRGINLRDQSINQRLAKQASRHGKLATIDLSSASDLISTQLVFDLLPLDWFCLLDSIRVKSTLIDGKIHELNMFSSMGNGFTFELESLLFYALTTAICYCLGVRGRVSVYGDDIVVPVKAAGMLAKVFAWFGFKVNAKKSYWSGGFRESCGKHYYYGADVTPFFVRERIRTLPQLIQVLNQYRLWATQEDVCIKDVSVEPSQVWLRFSGYVPLFLHGGKDCNETTSLVTTDNPRQSLARVKRDVRAADDGAYLHWLRGREELDNELQTSSGVFEGDYFSRRNRTWELKLPTCQCWRFELPSVPALPLLPSVIPTQIGVDSEGQRVWSLCGLRRRREIVGKLPPQLHSLFAEALIRFWS